MRYIYAQIILHSFCFIPKWKKEKLTQQFIQVSFNRFKFVLKNNLPSVSLTTHGLGQFPTPRADSFPLLTAQPLNNIFITYSHRCQCSTTRFPLVHFHMKRCITIADFFTLSGEDKKLYLHLYKYIVLMSLHM